MASGLPSPWMNFGGDELRRGRALERFDPWSRRQARILMKRGCCDPSVGAGEGLNTSTPFPAYGSCRQRPESRGAGTACIQQGCGLGSAGVDRVAPQGSGSTSRSRGGTPLSYTARLKGSRPRAGRQRQGGLVLTAPPGSPPPPHGWSPEPGWAGACPTNRARLAAASTGRDGLPTAWRTRLHVFCLPKANAETTRAPCLAGTGLTAGLLPGRQDGRAHRTAQPSQGTSAAR